MTATPGPWKATRDPHGSPSDYCIGMETDVARIDRVATCSACDAALIAAAPDMYCALQALLVTHIAHHNHPDHVAARAALAKATRNPT